MNRNRFVDTAYYDSMVHIMAPATTHTKLQYSELTQEHHPVNDWNRIILAIKAGRFDNEVEYEEIEQRDSKKSVYSQSFTPRKKSKFGMEVLVPGVCRRLIWKLQRRFKVC
jgi:hypothetical protein